MDETEIPSFVENEYDVGDVFTYRVMSDQGTHLRKEKISHINTATIDWETSFNSTFTSYLNPFLPQQKWTTWQKRSELDSLNRGNNFLAPLHIGQSDSLVYSNTVVDFTNKEERSYSQIWRCTVEGREKASTLLGDFDTYKVVCGRNKYSSGYYYGSTTYFYSPQLKRWVVKIENPIRNAPIRTELISILPNPMAIYDETHDIIRDIKQETLETMVSFQTNSVSVDGMHYSITPIKTYHTMDGLFCREYLEEYQLEKAIYPSNAYACRMGAYEWVKR